MDGTLFGTQSFYTVEIQQERRGIGFLDGDIDLGAVMRELR
ncbi:hypothetical protein [Sporocytophaga myxococcoides]|nr:hypothetical protein [Sporocytophaga myxococcoides]